MRERQWQLQEPSHRGTYYLARGKLLDQEPRISDPWEILILHLDHWDLRISQLSPRLIRTFGIFCWDEGNEITILLDSRKWKYAGVCAQPRSQIRRPWGKRVREEVRSGEGEGWGIPFSKVACHWGRYLRILIFHFPSSLTYSFSYNAPKSISHLK